MSEPIDTPIKADGGKARPDLLPFSALESVSQVLAFGAVKYGPHNWRRGNGLAYSRLLGAALRHLFAFARREENDPETGLPHLAHAACCILFLLDYHVTGSGQDDRP